MTIENQVKELEKLKGAALRAKYREVIGSDTKSNNRPYLIKKIVQALQPRAQSEISAASEPLDKQTAAKKNTDEPHELAIGSTITRVYQGKTLKAKLTEEGKLLFRGKVYSPSRAAFVATGTIWNGKVFWNLKKRATKQ